MKKLKVMSVFGTRPEAIKMAPLIAELRSRPEIEPVVCVTGQHREMLDQVLTAFSIMPDYDLDIMETQQTLSSITTKALLGLQDVLTEAKPDMVLVHGDTTTTFASALAAFYQRIPVGHVEAGLRSFDRYSPYPEEMNRCLAGTLAEFHFAPTAANAANLACESKPGRVFITGNTVIDALKTTVRDMYTFGENALNGLDFNRPIVLLTAHRRENYGEPMENIFRAIARLARDNPDITVVDPVHLSPYVREVANRCLDGIPNVVLTAPIGVLDMHNLMARCSFVMTDSGGLQEEAPALGKPVLVLRRETERPEAVAAGTVKMVGTEEQDIYDAAMTFLHDEAEFARMARAVNPYGDGKACARIADNLLHCFGFAAQPASPFTV